MNRITQQSNNNSPKPTWMINGTCGGCRSFEVAPNQKDLANVQCSNEESKHFGTTPGFMAINGCSNYEPKEKAPEGFVLV